MRRSRPPTRLLAFAALLALVVLAGCAGVLEDGTSVDGSDAGDGTAAPDNPWRAETVVVGVDDSANESRDLDPVVGRAVDYWNGEGTQYGTYDVEFVLRSDAEEPDVIVRLVETVDCDGAVAAGCASLLNTSNRADRPEEVQLQEGYVDDSLALVAKHEFGHLLGLRHDDEPRAVMRPELELVRYRLPGPADRENPWEREELSVAVDWASLPAEYTRTETARQLRETLAYFEDGADGTLPAISFRTVENASAANVTVDFGTDACGSGEGSCGSFRGRDLDGRDTVNVYSSLDVALAGVDQATVGWHVGYWLAMSLTGEDEAALPAPFVDADYEERRDWWESA